MSDIMLWKQETDLMVTARSRALLKASALQMTQKFKAFILSCISSVCGEEKCSKSAFNVPNGQKLRTRREGTQQPQSGSEAYKDVEINDSKSKLKVAQNGYLAPLSPQPQSVNLFSFAACAAPLRAWRRNTKEAGCCISLSLELFKEHAAPRLHANAIVILVLLFAAAALTFGAFRESFFSGERKLSAERRGGLLSLRSCSDLIEGP